MLRVSTIKNGEEYDLNSVMGKSRGDGDIPHAQLLCDFAEAIVDKDDAKLKRIRDRITDLMGEPAMIDAAAAAASFHGFVRIADATGIPPEKAGGGQITDEFRRELGINDFYKAQNA